MNERIKQLAEQAGGYVSLSHEHDGKLILSGENIVQKFAELIVAECSKVIVNGGYWSGGPLGPKRQCTPPEIAQMVKQHFGVEE